MTFDLSQHIPFNAFAFIWILAVLAGISLFNRNDKGGN